MRSEVIFAIICLLFIVAPLSLVVLCSLCRIARLADEDIEYFRRARDTQHRDKLPGQLASFKQAPSRDSVIARADGQQTAQEATGNACCSFKPHTADTAQERSALCNQSDKPGLHPSQSPTLAAGAYRHCPNCDFALSRYDDCCPVCSQEFES